MNTLANRNNQNGVGMIEVLVALFILAVGLLGVLAMQANSIKGSQKSQFSTQAQFLAQDMVDRIVAFNDIDDPNDDDDYDDLDTDDADADDAACAATGCDAAAQKAYDTWDWGTQVTSRLPNGKGTVEYDDTDDKYVVTVMWDSELNGATGEDCTGASGQMACYILEFKL